MSGSEGVFHESNKSCEACDEARENGYRACDGCEDGPSDEERIDAAYPWRAGFAGG